jgi:hypothetical protein
MVEEVDVKELGEQELKELIKQAKVDIDPSNPYETLQRLRGVFSSLRKDNAADGNYKLLNKINGLASLVELQARQRGEVKCLQVCEPGTACPPFPVWSQGLR